MNENPTFPPFQQSQFPVSPTPTEAPSATTSAPAVEKKPRKKRGGRRTLVATEPETPARPVPAAPRKAKRPPRRASPVRRPRRNSVRRPKRASFDFAVAAMFVGLQDGDGPLLTEIAERLQQAPAAQRQRVLAIVNRVFSDV